VVSIFGATDPRLREKVVSNMKEIQARGGTVVGITSGNDELVAKSADMTLAIPSSGIDFLDALLSVIPLQLLAYHVARINGHDIDMPRNLAKSVTVE
jgi:glucosamine--fructose-6-phosphate aminotransferase (isomerizing)